MNPKHAKYTLPPAEINRRFPTWSSQQDAGGKGWSRYRVRIFVLEGETETDSESVGLLVQNLQTPEVDA